MTASADKLYAMMENGVIYSFEPSTAQYAVVTRVTPWPAIDFEIPMAKQSYQAKKAMGEAITDIVIDDHNPAALYGFNKLTGSFGLIDAEGVHFQSIRMDTSCFFEAGSDYAELPFYQPQIVGDYLEGWTIPDIEGNPSVEWITLSIIDGSCKKFVIEGAFQLCRLPNDELLVARLKETGSIVLEVFDKCGQYIKPFEVALPGISDCSKKTTQELQNIIGAFLYENGNNSLYYIDASHLYESSNGKPFTVIDSNVPWVSLLVPNNILGSVSKVARMQQGREKHAKNIGEPKGESANESNNHQYEVIRWRGVLK